MKIVAVYGEDYPWDIRVEKILKGFQAVGHEVRLVCRNLGRRQLREDVGGIQCRRVVGPGLYPALNAAISLPAFFSPVWKAAVLETARELDADMLLVRDLPLAPLAISVGRALGVPVLVDMAENHPAMWRNHYRSARWKLPAFVLKNPWLAAQMEQATARQADGILVVVDEMRERLSALGATPERIAVVSNTPDLDRFDVATPIAPPGVARGGYVEFIYVGYITKTRGLQQVIQAIAEVGDLPVPPRLHIMGTGNYTAELSRLCAALGLDKQVLFHGWVDFALVPAYIGWADIGLIPHLKTEHTDTTIPNKIFDYMACAKPVLVSNARPLERVVREHDCGMVFQDGDILSIAKALGIMCSGRERESWGRNGRRAVESRYNWRHDMKIAASFLNSIFETGASPAS